MMLKGGWKMGNGKWAGYKCPLVWSGKGRMENGKWAEYRCPSDSDIT